MINQVIKKDGTKEPFDAEKVRRSIKSAADDAGLSEDRTAEVVDIVTRSVMKALEGREDVPTAEIRERVLATLHTVEPSVSEAWQKYDKDQKENA